MTTHRHLGTALITGASTGIGALYAERLAHRGYDLILVARNQHKLAALAQRLRIETQRSIEVLAADLTDRKDVARVEAALRSNAGINVLVNNAGMGSGAPLLSSDVELMERMIDLNVTALTRLTYAAVPGFVARRSGTIINIASVVGIAPELLNGVYGASKAFVLAFSRSLQKELAPHAIRVQAVLPGATATDFWDVAGIPIATLPKEIQERVMPAADLVDAALAGLDQGESVTIPALPDVADWTAYERARENLLPNLSRAKPAVRYAIQSTSARVA
jgi:uncharacterized protein